MQGIIWLASYPKSGNTWMRAFLANLFAGENEPVSFDRMSRFIPGEPMLTWYKKILGEDFPVDDPQAVADKRGFIHAKIAQSSQSPVFLKTHSYLGQVLGREVINMGVTVGAIYIVRNPLDVVVSAAPHYNLSIDKTIDMMADEHMQSDTTTKMVYERVTDWSTHVFSWTQTPHPSLLVLRYEDMLDKPLRAFTKVTRFIKLNKSKKGIGQAITNASFKSLKNLETETGFEERPEHSKSFFREGKTEQWRSVLTDDQIKKIIETHYEQMKRFKYIPKDYA